MKTIAVFYQGRKQVTIQFAQELVPSLKKKGYQVRAIDLQQEPEESNQSILADCNLVLVLGGDGSIVHTARLCAKSGIPLVGVNFGRVGFLAELEPDAFSTTFDYYLDGDASVWLDSRTMLAATLEQDGKREDFLALNDVVIARGTWPRGVEVSVWVDDDFYNRSYADGMIISTATGSTAYNMAVGGPLLHPQVQSMLMSPIAAHLAFDRSLVLHPEAKLKLQITTGTQDGVFSADGQINRLLKDGAIVTVQKSQYVTKFLRRRPATEFYQIINAKLRHDSSPIIESSHANRVND